MMRTTIAPRVARADVVAPTLTISMMIAAANGARARVAPDMLMMMTLLRARVGKLADVHAIATVTGDLVAGWVEMATLRQQQHDDDLNEREGAYERARQLADQ
jgi:hypothetical protein